MDARENYIKILSGIQTDSRLMVAPEAIKTVQ